MPAPAVRAVDITLELRRLGLRAGDLVMAHSSLKSFGYVAGGAEAVVEGLLAAVAPGGTLLVPTFNHGTAAVFDPRVTRSGSGAVTEAVRLRPEAVRSLHPSHPYAAIGPRAQELTAGHLEVGTFDPRSPLGKLADWGGWIVLLGVGMWANTCVHIGEVAYGVHCLGYERERSLVRIDGEVHAVRTTLWRADGHCHVEGEPIDARLRARDLVVDGKIGNAPVHLMRGRAVVETTAELCAEVCPGCPLRPDWTSPRAVSL
jgi:aminoglycoside 3-N-acetyltransferase